MYLLYSRHVSALILGHHHVNLQNIKKNHCLYNGSVVSNSTSILKYFVNCCEKEGIIYSLRK
jgi:hypothetical protein